MLICCALVDFCACWQQYCACNSVIVKWSLYGGLPLSAGQSRSYVQHLIFNEQSCWLRLVIILFHENSDRNVFFDCHDTTKNYANCSLHCVPGCHWVCIELVFVYRAVDPSLQHRKCNCYMNGNCWALLIEYLAQQMAQTKMYVTFVSNWNNNEIICF